MPSDMQKKLQSDILNFINFPHKVSTISQMEMWKIKSHGGLKLINIQIKSEISKVKWLIELASKTELKTNLDIFTALTGTQKGNISGRDLLFLEQSYIKNTLNTNSKFYKEALMSLSKFNTRKGISNIEKWDTEHIFYNPLFITKNGKTLILTKYCENKGIFRLEQVLEEKAKESRKLEFDKVQSNLYNKILLNTDVRKDDILIIREEEIKFSQITHKQLYEQALLPLERDHHSQVKWVLKLDTAIPWQEVWEAVNNFLSTNETKNIIWQQIHLNFYTQYSYNKWHKVSDNCPLCQKIPESIYHLILHCDVTNKLWDDIQRTLHKLHPIPVSDEEKALGLFQKNPSIGILLRNWLTFFLRKCIADSEREAFYDTGESIIVKIKRKVNRAIGVEIDMKAYRYKHENNLAFFDKIITHAQVLCEKNQNEEYTIKNVFT